MASITTMSDAPSELTASSFATPPASTSTILLCLPMISKMSLRLAVNPSSVKVSRVISIILSQSFCSIEMMRPPTRCFLKSMQNGEGEGGFPGLSSIRCMRGAVLPADAKRRLFPLGVCTVNTSSSRMGWWILSIFPCRSVALSSLTIALVIIPSNAIHQ